MLGEPLSAAAASDDVALISIESVTGYINSVWRAKVLVNKFLSAVSHDALLARFLLKFGGVLVRNPLVVWGKPPK